MSSKKSTLRVSDITYPPPPNLHRVQLKFTTTNNHSSAQCYDVHADQRKGKQDTPGTKEIRIGLLPSRSPPRLLQELGGGAIAIRLWPAIPHFSVRVQTFPFLLLRNTCANNIPVVGVGGQLIRICLLWRLICIVVQVGDVRAFGRVLFRCRLGVAAGGPSSISSVSRAIASTIPLILVVLATGQRNPEIEAMGKSGKKRMDTINLPWTGKDYLSSSINLSSQLFLVHFLPCLFSIHLVLLTKSP